MKTRIDPQKCIGCTLCTALCPHIYKMESDKAVVFVGTLQDEAEICARNAAAQCPVEAISMSKD